MSHYNVKFVPGTENHCWNKAVALIRENSTVLDVGCSTGDFGRALTEHKHSTVDGVEPDGEDARLASKVLENVFNGTVEDAFKSVLRDKKYDHIVFMDVIEHLANPSQVLASLLPHLAKGGSIIFSIPNMAHISTRLMLLSGKFDYGYTGLLDYTHLHFYTKEEVERVFNEAGYEVETWDYTEATYPEELITKELKTLGFTANKNALKLLQREDARVFQFVGRAIPKRITSVRKRIEYSPDPQGQIVRHYEEKIHSVNLQLSEKDIQISERENIIRDLRQKLSNTDYIANQVPFRRYMKQLMKRKLNRK